MISLVKKSLTQFQVYGSVRTEKSPICAGKWIKLSSTSFKSWYTREINEIKSVFVMVLRHFKQLTLAGGRRTIHLQPLTQSACKNLAPHQGESGVTAITDNIT